MSLQMSWLASSMIWSMFSVSWMRVVTSWSWRKNSASNDTPRLSGGNCCESKKACVSLPWRSTALIGISWSGGTGNRCSQFELLAGTQPTDVVRDIRAEGLGLIEPLDLGHDQIRFGGLGVRDVDRERVARLDAVKLLGQRQRRQVQAAPREVFLAIAEGGLDHQRRHVHGVDAPPERWVALGVSREHPVGPGRTRHGIADRGHGVDGGQHLDHLAADLQSLVHLDFLERNEWLLGRGNAAEVGPDHVVEDV